jgi:hypothetical protein
MSFVSTIIGTAERVPLPDVIIRAAIHRLCSRTATRLSAGSAESDACFAGEMAARPIYGDDTNLWMRRWRWFFLATSGLFGYAGGSEWGVSHYRMKAG